MADFCGKSSCRFVACVKRTFVDYLAFKLVLFWGCEILT
jgi:hypothetical protein